MPLRTVIETPEFAGDLRRIGMDAVMADDILFGLKWTLSHAPEIGERILDSNVWFIACNSGEPYVGYGVYYAFDENRVFLISIRETRLQDSFDL